MRSKTSENPFASAENIVAFDVDNTAWNWVEMKDLEVKLMADYISAQTGSDPDDVRQSMIEVYQKVGSSDFSGVVQRMDMLKGSSPSDINALKEGCMNACMNLRSQRFKPYDGIKESLIELSSDPKIALCTISDAPMYQAIMRLRRAKLQEFFDKIYAQPNEYDDYVQVVMKKADSIQLPYAFLPNKKPDIDLSELFGIPEDEIREKLIMIGNSMKADLGLAYRNKARCILAGWGRVPAKLAESVYRLSHPHASISDMEIRQEDVNCIQDMGKRLRVLEDSREIPATIREMMAA